jgi:hypothetical protein
MMSARTRNLLFVATSFLIVSYEACSRAAAHDQSGLCIFDPSILPRLLAFENWISLGMTLGVLGAGVAMGAIMLAVRRN